MMRPRPLTVRRHAQSEEIKAIKAECAREAARAVAQVLEKHGYTASPVLSESRFQIVIAGPPQGPLQRWRIQVSQAAK